MAATVLIVAYDRATTATYGGYLKRDYATIAAHSGRQALAQVKAHRFDVIVVDTTSPRLNAKTICRKLRSVCSAPLVLIASAGTKGDGVQDSISAIPASAAGKKLLPRVKAALEAKPPRQLTIGSVSLDLENHRLTRGSKSFQLTPKEFFLLKLLMGRAGQTITRKTLMKDIWETDYLGDTRTLDVHIRWVRQKVEDSPSKPQRLVTVRGQGYKYRLEGA